MGTLWSSIQIWHFTTQLLIFEVENKSFFGWNLNGHWSQSLVPQVGKTSKSLMLIEELGRETNCPSTSTLLWMWMGHYFNQDHKTRFFKTPVSTHPTPRSAWLIINTVHSLLTKVCESTKALLIIKYLLKHKIGYIYQHNTINSIPQHTV